MCVCVLNTVCMETGERVCVYDMLIKFEGYREPCMNSSQFLRNIQRRGKLGKCIA